MQIEAQVLLAQIDELIKKHQIPNLPDAPSEFLLGVYEVQIMVLNMELEELKRMDEMYNQMNKEEV